MEPKRLSKVLRQIACEIDSSSKPSKHKVLKDLRYVMSTLESNSLSQEILDQWSEEGPSIFNEVYEQDGWKKNKIEDAKTNVEYELMVLKCVRAAWDEWAENKAPEFSILKINDRLELMYRCLASEKAKYGFYRGNLPDKSVITTLLKKFF